jgi:hypothetical protein
VSRSVPADARRKLLAGYLERTRGTRLQADDSIPPRPPGVEVEASEVQQQLWLHLELAGGVPLYNEPVTVHYHGELDVAAFERAFNEILRRHEAWRTSFVWRDGKLLQIVAPELKIELWPTDLRKLPISKREERALSWAVKDAKAPFDLAKLPLFRPRLFRIQDEEYRLYLTLHHIIFDGVSLYRIFLPELQALYAAYVTGAETALPPVTVHYPDYSYWHRQWLLSGGADEQLSYWKDALSGELPELRLPLDHPRPAVTTHAGAMVTFTIPPHTTALLNQIAQAWNATLFMTVVAAFHVLLYHYTGDCDQIIGSMSSSRKYSATLHMLGLFLNTIVLRTKFLPEEGFAVLVARVREVTLNALSNDDVPFSLLDRTRKAGLSPLFRVMFSLEPPLSSLSSGWGFTQMDVETDVSKVDLHLELDEREEGLIGRFIYSTELFDEKTIRQMTAAWILLMESVTRAPEQSISQLSERLRTSSGKSDSGRISLLEKFQKLWQ